MAEGASRQRAKGRGPSSQLSLDLPVRVQVERGGKRYPGEVVIASGWSAALGAGPTEGLAFRIVLLTRPLALRAEALASPRVIVCIPSRALSGARIAEAPGLYLAGAQAVLPWPPEELEAFSEGAILGGGVRQADPAQLFGSGEWEAILDRLAWLVDLEELGPQVAVVEAYLRDAVPRQSDDELYLDRLSLLEQLSAGTAFRDPGIWPSVKALFDLFKSRYIRAYLRHHRVYRLEMASLRRRLAGAEREARALRLLNGVEELGPPVGETALAAYAAFQASMVPCGWAEEELTSLSTEPLCPSCRVPLSGSPPTAPVAEAAETLHAALQEQQRRLSAQVVNQILGRQGEAPTDQFVKLLQAADTGALPEVLDEELADFLRHLLREVTIELPLEALLEELRDRFPTVSEEQVEAFATGLGGVLRQAIQQARDAHPGKQVRLKLR